MATGSGKAAGKKAAAVAGGRSRFQDDFSSRRDGVVYGAAMAVKMAPGVEAVTPLLRVSCHLA